MPGQANCRMLSKSASGNSPSSNLFKQRWDPPRIPHKPRYVIRVFVPHSWTALFSQDREKRKGTVDVGQAVFDGLPGVARRNPPRRSPNRREKSGEGPSDALRCIYRQKTTWVPV